MLDWILRIAVTLALLLVILLAGRALHWVLLGSSTLLVQPFEVIRDGKPEKAHGASFSRLLAHEISTLDQILTKDLTEYREVHPAVVIALPTGSDARRLSAVVEDRINVDFRPFDFDVIGIFDLLYARLRRGSSLSGVVAITQGSATVFCEFNRKEGTTKQLGPWTFTQQGDMSPAAKRLAREITLQHHHQEPMLAPFDSDDFGTFVEALIQYQEALRLSAAEKPAQSRKCLTTAEAQLSPLAHESTQNALVHTYLASIYMLMEDEPKALDQLRRARKLRPRDEWISSQIATLEELRELEEGLRITPAAPEVEFSLDEILKQPALEPWRLTAQPAGQPVRVAILSTGIHQLPQLQGRIAAGRSFFETPSTEDPNGHGTSIAALIAAIAPTAEIVSVKSLNDSGVASLEHVTAGIEWAIEDGAKIIVLGIGQPNWGDPAQWGRLASRARAMGALPIASAGNRGSSSPDFMPAAAPGFLAIGGLGEDGTRASFSDFGDWVHLYAPAQKISSLFGNGRVNVVSGNSYSCALAAGTAARLLAVNPSLSPDALQALLVSTAATSAQGLLRLDPSAAIRAATSPRSSG